MAPKWREHFRKPGKPKKSFLTEEAAQAFAEQNRVEHYQCGYCGNYHVGGNKHGFSREEQE